MSPNFRYKMLFLLVFQLLVGCAILSPRPKSDSFYTDFLNGDTRLECRVTCAFTFGTAIPDLMQLYNAGLWAELAKKVYNIGFNQNISYFYLGRAAEELNKPLAAETYYKLAKSAPPCILNGCSGFKFPDIIEHRLLVLKTAQKEVKLDETRTLKPDSKNYDFNPIDSPKQKCIDFGFEVGTEKFKTCLEKSQKY